MIHGLGLAVGMGCSSLGLDTFLPEGREHLPSRSHGFVGVWAPCLPHLLPLWCLLIVGSGPTLG